MASVQTAPKIGPPDFTGHMTERVREILSWYESDNPGTKTNLARMLNHGRLAGTGKFVILPVDRDLSTGRRAVSP